ncbi:SCO2322 family protein [Streptomyces odontomachi]|uniref:SCO2322 family protein n=1 Tax=Streptomyces odontomachi TaxID=2944940 RepID=UPI00210E78D3|nr:SCO2322 family protein [Streptomyces sp. ODS25]
MTRRPVRGTRRRPLGGAGLRRALTGALLALALALVALVTAGPAEAAGYRYWSFWQLDRGDAGGGSWAYATQGPSVARPDDGAVVGFRFAVSADSKDATRPRGGHDFTTICAGTPARSATKRIALVLDFGTTADAPQGERPPERRTACARVEKDATAADALASVAEPLRYNSNLLLCAIAGYPRTGCGEQVSGAKPAGGSTAQASAKASQEAAGHHIPSASVLVGVAAVALLGVAAVWQARRRRG